VYDLRIRSGSRLPAPSLWEACCVVLAIAYAATTRPGTAQYAFPLLAMIVIYVFSFDQGAVSKMLRSRALQKLGLWSYSIYMIHVFVFQVMKMIASYVGHKTHLELVGWHNDDKLMLLGTPQQAVLPALILSVVLVVPVAALSYRLIEKPAMEFARQGLPIGFGPALRAQVRSLVVSTRISIGRGASAIAARGAAGVRTGLSLFVVRQRTVR
jgi:peptidoglycan/LPS O-acetylase OafA/YrhL